jgi:uncharacterized protein (TIGR03118 family)
MDSTLANQTMLRRARWMAGVAALGFGAVQGCNSDGGGAAYGSGGASSGGARSTGGAPGSGGAPPANGGTSPSSGGVVNNGGADAGTGAIPDAGVDDAGDGGVTALTVLETPLVSDDDAAPTHDPNLLNAWGLAINPDAKGGPFFWVAANHVGVLAVYDATGKVIPLVVDVDPADGGPKGASPTGQVFNAGTHFKGDKFITDGEDGKISGWQSGTHAVLRADESASGAIYKGLAIARDTLWAANFHAGSVDVFDDSYGMLTLKPTDPDIPSGYAPFNVVDLDGKVYVAYAKQDADAEDDEAGPGHGFVDVFTEAGQLDHRLVSAGPLNSPWGMVMAPPAFGALSGTLLVGNFGDGTVHAFDATTGALRGSLVKSAGQPLTISGLWDLKFGPKTASGDLTSTLFFTAGPAAEAHGLFGKLEINR